MSVDELRLDEASNPRPPENTAPPPDDASVPATDGQQGGQTYEIDSEFVLLLTHTLSTPLGLFCRVSTQGSCATVIALLLFYGRPA